MRALLAALSLVACAPAAHSGGPSGGPSSGPAPLPVTESAPLSLAWDVYWQGITIGRAELESGAQRARATFATNRVARMLANVRYDLTTTAATADESIAIGRDASARHVELDGANFTIDAQPGVVPGGSALHTPTSLLTAMRAWASPYAKRTFAWLVVDGALYRIDLAAPVSERLDGVRTLRVDTVVRPLEKDGERLGITLWLAGAGEHAPLKIVVDARGERVVAQLAETSLTAR